MSDLSAIFSALEVIITGICFEYWSSGLTEYFMILCLLLFLNCFLSDSGHWYIYIYINSDLKLHSPSSFRGSFVLFQLELMFQNSAFTGCYILMKSFLESWQSSQQCLARRVCLFICLFVFFFFLHMFCSNMPTGKALSVLRIPTGLCPKKGIITFWIIFEQCCSLCQWTATVWGAQPGDWWRDNWEIMG